MSSIDLQLRKLAAQAAGLVDVHGVYYGGPEWNPLTNDVDAFRLAVRLRMLVDVTADGYSHVVLETCPSADMDCCEFIEPHNAGPLAATRRAIVRAAAALAAAATPEGAANTNATEADDGR